MNTTDTIRLPLVALSMFLAGAGCEQASAPATPDATHDATPEATPEATPTVDDLATATKRYGSLLAEVVTDDGLVRYDLLAEPSRRATLRAVVAAFAATPLPADRDDRLALWCNAYNANVLDKALAASRQPGFKGVDKVRGFFDETSITVAGEKLTLNDLENTRIRPLNDARIHAALVCAALSCPPLRNEPYSAARLDEQLDDQCTRWVNDSRKFKVTPKGLGLSEILKWYAEDFEKPPYGNSVGFVLAFASPGADIARYVVNTEKHRIEWLTYDWALNQSHEKAPTEGS